MKAIYLSETEVKGLIGLVVEKVAMSKTLSNEKNKCKKLVSKLVDGLCDKERIMGGMKRVEITEEERDLLVSYSLKVMEVESEHLTAAQAGELNWNLLAMRFEAEEV